MRSRAAGSGRGTLCCKTPIPLFLSVIQSHLVYFFIPCFSLPLHRSIAHPFISLPPFNPLSPSLHFSRLVVVKSAAKSFHSTHLIIFPINELIPERIRFFLSQFHYFKALSINHTFSSFLQINRSVHFSFLHFSATFHALAFLCFHPITVLLCFLLFLFLFLCSIVKLLAFCRNHGWLVLVFSENSDNEQLPCSDELCLCDFCVSALLSDAINCESADVLRPEQWKWNPGENQLIRLLLANPFPFNHSFRRVLFCWFFLNWFDKSVFYSLANPLSVLFESKTQRMW